MRPDAESRFVGKRQRTVACERGRKRAVRPDLEGLECRQLLSAVNGGKLAYGSRITYSFAPDGTNVGGYSSNLFAELNAIAPTATWASAFENAAAVWSSYAHINLALVPDNGAPVGTSGDQQDDPRFGDIRISMVPMSSSVLAYCMLPPPYNGGTLADDIVFNSNQAWQINRGYDIETVALHEFGHALGMDHSSIASAVMYAYYNGTKQSLTSDDIGGIQGVWGAYPADSTNNGSFSTATVLTPDQNGQISLGGQSIAGPNDYEYYAVTVPASTTGNMSVSMQSAGLSSLTPRLVIYDSAHNDLTQVSLPNVNGGTATAVISGVKAGQTYYIRASGASIPGLYGAFGLLVNFGSRAQAPIAPPNTLVASQPNQGGGSSNDSIDQGTVEVSNDFNGTPISYNPTGTANYIWFNSAFQPSGLNSSSKVTIHVTDQFIDFTDPQSGTHYHLAVPDATITFSPNTTVATTTFDAGTGAWITNLPSSNLSGNEFLSALAFKVPLGGLAGGIKNVAWSGTFSTDTPGVSIQWKWGAAVYNSLSANYNAVGVKPVDDNHASTYQNSDQAGTPENFTIAGILPSGATGGGGSNWTGGLSGTMSIPELTLGSLTGYADALEANPKFRHQSIPAHTPRRHDDTSKGDQPRSNEKTVRVVLRNHATNQKLKGHGANDQKARHDSHR